jgi:glycolate oxidase
MMDPTARLRAELGNAFSTADDVREAARADRSGWRSDSAPIGVVSARSRDDVQMTLRLASAYRIPVVPRGAATGLAGGATARAGELVLDVSAMNRILRIVPDDELAVVQPGVINGDLDDALAPHGLWFAPDPASRRISTVGGNIATGAGGLLCAKYGVTREAVLGLEVVLADGRAVRVGHSTVKGVTGYDLTALFVGSEGTLGVITEATVRALPRPAAPSATVVALFAGTREAAEAASAITANRLRPALCELMDAGVLSAVAAYVAGGTAGGTGRGAGSAHGDLDGALLADLRGDSPRGGGAGACLVVQFDDADAAERAERTVTLVERWAGRATVSRNAAEASALLELRRACHAALAAQGEVLIEDVAVPRSRLADMFETITAIEAEYGVRIPTLAHAGDGNLHPNLVYEGADVPERVWQAAGAVFTAALRLGGTLTGEHGVGVLKRRWLHDEIGDDSYDLQRGIKAVFDPLGILAPGKVFA